MPRAEHRRSAGLLATALATLAAAVALCCHSSANTITLTAADNGRTIMVEVGDKIEVTLEAVGPFYFGSPIVSSMSVRFLGESDQLPNQPNPGGGKTQRYSFEAAAAGRADVTIPRELPTPEPPTFRITAQVY